MNYNYVFLQNKNDIVLPAVKMC